MAGNQELITAQVLAEALDLSVETIWRYTREKKIPYIELSSKQYRYTLDEVVSALTNAVREGATPYNTDSSKKYTYQDYLGLPDEPGYRFEVLEGMLIREPSPNVIHQRVSRRLQRILEDYFWETDSEGEIFNAPLDVTFKDISVVQPDVFYVAGKQKQIVKENRIDGSPTLVVEILSPSTGRKDRLQKLLIYQKYEIQHYWLVNPQEKTLECFFLKDSTYTLVSAGMEDEVIEHPSFKGLAIELGNLWK